MRRLVIANAEVFDGTGAPPRLVDVAIEDERIAAVAAGLSGDQVLDARGDTLVPGLIDCHVHALVHEIDVWQLAQQPFTYRLLQAIRDLEETLASGVTTVRDCAGADLGVQEALRDGLVAGPRMQISINMLSRTGGHADYWLPSGASLGILPSVPGMPPNVVDGPDEMRRAVRTLVRAGANFIKIAATGGTLSPRSNPQRPQFTEPELSVLVEEAALAGVPVVAHAHGADGIKAAVRAGVRSIEHGVYLDEEAVELMLERGTYLVPTLTASTSVLAVAEAGGNVHASTLEKQRRALESHVASFSMAYQAGVRIAMGTDAGVTRHGDNPAELEAMVGHGMSPAEALLAATGVAAKLLDLDREIGTIEVGKRADLVLLRGGGLTPSKERVRVVFKDGTVVNRPSAAGPHAPFESGLAYVDRHEHAAGPRGAR